MVKEKKRKGRLNKGEGGDFIGFGAFATTTTSGAPPGGSTATTTTTTASPSSTSNNNMVIPHGSSSPTATTAATTTLISPVYTGSDSAIGILFNRISQKRDATTKAKALQELLSYFQDDSGTTTSTNNDNSNSSNNPPTKRQQIDALNHFLYLYMTKLYYYHDSQTASREIRSLALQVLTAAQTRLPKAFANHFNVTPNAATAANNNNNTTSPTTTTTTLWILGMIVCAQSDPATEVRTAATALSHRLVQQAAAASAAEAEEEEETDSDNNHNNNNNNNTTTKHAIAGSTLDQGVFCFCQKMLSYNKPIDMHRDLFQRGSGSGGSEKKNEALSDRNMEELEEKYERIVGMALDGMNLYVQEPTVLTRLTTHHESNNNVSLTSSSDNGLPSKPENVKYLWKMIHNTSRPALRRKTYLLLSTFCQKLPFLLDVDKTSKMILQALSSEKEPANIAPSLLETLLAFVASQPREERSSMMTGYAKGLAKLFKKGCYGATASTWTQMILPIVALLPASSASSSGEDGGGGGAGAPQANVLTSVWEGRTHLVGVADTLDAVQAVVETSSFLLVQQSPNDLDQVLATCWIQGLQTYLASSDVYGGAIRQAQDRLKTILAKSWVSFAKTCVEKPSSAIYALKEWFWSEQLPDVILSDKANTQHLTLLLQQIRQNEWPSSSSSANNESTSNSRDDGIIILCSPVLRQKFHNLLAPMGVEDSWVPTQRLLLLCIEIVRLVSSSEVFVQDDIANEKAGEAADGVDTFVMRKLLPWMVRHTSSRSDLCDPKMSKLEAELFLVCVANNNQATSSASGSLCETVLREVIAAEPDLDILWDYLCLYTTQGRWTTTDFVNMHALQSLFVHVATDSVLRTSSLAEQNIESTVDEDHHNDEKENQYRKTSGFFRNITGLGDSEQLLGSIVSRKVISSWLDLACPDDSAVDVEPNPVLSVLVDLVKADRLVNDKQGSKRATVQTWRQGDDLWENTLLPWLLEPAHRANRSMLISGAKEESRQRLRNLLTDSKDASISSVWSQRAIRLLQLCEDSSCKEVSDIPLFSMSAVGLDDLKLWNKNELSQSTQLAQSLLQLIQNVDRSKRWSLFVNSDAKATELLVSMLIYLSCGSADPFEADLARRRRDLCATLLMELDFKYVDPSDLFEGCVMCVSTLSSILRDAVESTDSKKVCQSIAVLSQLVLARFQKLQPAGHKTLDESVSKEVEAGSKLWYITNSDEPLVRKQCTIVKVHNDLPEEVYFTIKLESNAGTFERQTVGSRLRMHERPPLLQTGESDEQLLPIDAVDEEERQVRDRIASAILDSLVTPFASSWNDPCYEVYNIMVTQVGLLRRGIGSTHYSVLQKLMTLEAELMALLESSSPDQQSLATILWKLSLSLGYGMNVPSSPWASSLLGMNASNTLPAILAYEQDPEIESNTQLDCALAAWVSVASYTCEDKDVRRESYSSLFRIAARLLQTRNDSETGFDGAHYIALRAIQVGQQESHKLKQGESTIEDDEAEALSEMIKAFSEEWQSTDEPEDGPVAHSLAFESLPLFQRVMQATLSERPQLVANAARRCLDELTDGLYDPEKRGFAMKILETYTSERRPIHDDEAFDIINANTANKLEEWANDVPEEEAELMEDMVHAVAQWTGSEQMNDIESWHDDYDINDTVACGRMLSWLSFLQIVDAASIKDAVFYRPSFTSYVSCCDAVDAILDLAMVYGNVGEARKVKLDAVEPLNVILGHSTSSSGSSIELSKLAAMVIFRSIEVFPTLSKEWWESDCPGYMKQAVQDFVESQVSPEILSRSIESIQQATAFGEMKVKGSAATRQVTASYVQDDFTLSVVIELPLAFPFRRAVVDCSRTLGIPESRWKRWSLQITQMLNNQGGTLKEALLFWKENVDKEFEGVEPCPVCYSVLHVRTHKLPNLECRTCKNRFHTDCLFEWFRNSGKSSCVICQQPWSGSRV